MDSNASVILPRFPLSYISASFSNEVSFESIKVTIYFCCWNCSNI